MSGGHLERSATTRLYAVVTTYRRPEVAEKAVRALLEQSRPPDGIVLVENSEEAQLAGVFPPEQVEVIRPGTNTGAAGGFGTGADVALERGATHVVFVDDDCLLQPDALARLECNLLERVPGAVIGPVVVAPDGERLVWDVRRPDGRVYAGRSALPAHPISTRYLAWHGLALSADALRVAGAPRKDLFFGGEDGEFCRRLAAHGHALFTCPDAVAVHHETRYHQFWLFGERKVPAGTPGHRYYVLRNRLLTWRLYRGDDAVIGIRRLLAQELACALLSDRRRHRIRLLAKAIRDGLTGDPHRRMVNTVPLHD